MKPRILRQRKKLTGFNSTYSSRKVSIVGERPYSDICVLDRGITFDVGTLYDMLTPTSPDPKDRRITLRGGGSAGWLGVLSLPLEVNNRLKLRTFETLNCSALQVKYTSTGTSSCIKNLQKHNVDYINGIYNLKAQLFKSNATSDSY